MGRSCSIGRKGDTAFQGNSIVSTGSRPMTFPAAPIALKANVQAFARNFKLLTVVAAKRPKLLLQYLELFNDPKQMILNI